MDDAPVANYINQSVQITGANSIPGETKTKEEESKQGNGVQMNLSDVLPSRQPMKETKARQRMGVRMDLSNMFYSEEGTVHKTKTILCGSSQSHPKVKKFVQMDLSNIATSESVLNKSLNNPVKMIDLALKHLSI